MIIRDSLGQEDGIPIYTVVLDKLELCQKMILCRKNQKIKLYFTVNAKQLAVSIYPNSGDGWIKVYLCNETETNLYVDAQFSTESKSTNFSELALIPPGCGTGFPQF